VSLWAACSLAALGYSSNSTDSLILVVAPYASLALLIATASAAKAFALVHARILRRKLVTALAVGLRHVVVPFGVVPSTVAHFGDVIRLRA
jgi:hypothetical protein